MKTMTLGLLVAVVTVAVAIASQEEKQELPLDLVPGAPLEMRALDPLVGAWDVTMLVAKQDGSWQEQKTETTIAPILGGAALEQQIRIDYYGSVQMIGAWSYDRFQRVYRMAWLDDQAGLLDVYEGHMERGRLAVSNLRPNTYFLARGQRGYARQTLYDFTPTSFRMDYETSLDGGKTWQMTWKLRFTRKA